MTINITRGDSGEIRIRAFDNVDNEGEKLYVFQPGEVVRLKIFKKNACEEVVLQKDFPIEEEIESVSLILTEDDTRIGEVISKPVDYWYEIELNPDTEPQTIVGYDEDGAKIFRLYPEGRDISNDELTEEETETLRKILTEFKENEIPSITQEYVDANVISSVVAPNVWELKPKRMYWVLAYANLGKGAPTILFNGRRLLLVDVDGSNTVFTLFLNSTDNMPYDIIAGTISSEGELIGNLRYVENGCNKVTAIDENSTDEQYASAKAIYDEIQKQTQDKQGTLVSGQNIKTINGQSILGSGNIVIEGVETDGEPSDVAELRVAIDRLAVDMQYGNINNTGIELGNLNDNGEVAHATNTRCDDYIPVIGGNTIYAIFENTTFNGTTIKYLTLRMYDKDKNHLSYITLYGKNMLNNPSYTTEYTLPEDCAYIRFVLSSSGSVDYKIGFYYSYYNATTVEEYVEPIPYVDANKLVKNGRLIDVDTFAPQSNIDLADENIRTRLTADAQSKDENYIIPEYEYNVHMIDALRKQVSYLQEYISKLHTPTILDSGVCGENLTWALYSDGLLKISGTGRSYDYCKGILIGKTRAEIETYCATSGHTEYGFQDGKIYDDANGQYVSPWYKYRDEVDFVGYCSKSEYDAHNPNGWKYNRIEIDYGVTYLGDWMFYRVSGATELVVPNSVTELGDWAIRYSPTLKCIDVPDSVTKVGYRGCSRNEVATAIRMSKNLASVGDYAFSANLKVKYFAFGGAIATGNVYTFNGNTKLEYVTFNDVTEIPERAFIECSKLSKVDIPDTVTTIKYGAFMGTALKSVKIPVNVTDIETNAFHKCTNLKTVIIDSPTIAEGFIYGDIYGALMINAKYVYVKNDITTLGAFFTNKCTKIADVDGYVLYVVNE